MQTREITTVGARFGTAILENTGWITLFLEHGADLNTRDNEGRTALKYAADLARLIFEHCSMLEPIPRFKTNVEARRANRSSFQSPTQNAQRHAR
jgi:hypothetical protein